jgi:anti-sigma factor RsiW
MRVVRWIAWKLGLRELNPECEECRESASALLDNELATAQRTRVQHHFDICPPCSAFLASLRKTVAALRGMGQERAPESLKKTILRQSGRG